MLLNYNGQHLLEESLPSALQAAAAVGGCCPVVVVDNRSTEDDVAYVKANFPEVEVMVSEKNDFLFSLNTAVAQRSEDIVILLNNDMTFDEGFVPPLLQHFDDPLVFAVTTKIFYGKSPDVIMARTEMHRGFFQYTLRKIYDDTKARYTFHASGGAAAWRREMFLALQGYDTLYRPGYYEEVDLSYRAWKRGWKIIYEPRSRVYHRRSASFDKYFAREELNRTILRNALLFNVKNCGGWPFALVYLSLFPLRLARCVLQGNFEAARSFLAAIPRIPRALRHRFREAGKDRVLRDSDIMRFSRQPL